MIGKRRNHECPMENWEDMKAIMRKRLISSNYYREFYQKLQRLNQGFKIVDYYYKRNRGGNDKG